MKILVDMNLSPAWIPVLERLEIEAIHWSDVGKPDAPDTQIFAYARENKFVVFTHDLDFGDILAATGAESPSVIQLRTEDTSPNALSGVLQDAIRQFRSQLNDGALITIDLDKLRARILPVGDTNN